MARHKVRQQQQSLVAVRRRRPPRAAWRVAHAAADADAAVAAAHRVEIGVERRLPRTREAPALVGQQATLRERRRRLARRRPPGAVERRDCVGQLLGERRGRRMRVQNAREEAVPKEKRRAQPRDESSPLRLPSRSSERTQPRYGDASASPRPRPGTGAGPLCTFIRPCGSAAYPASTARRSWAPPALKGAA